MQTIHRLNTHELNMAFIKSLKSLFTNQDIEIVVKSVSSPLNDAVWAEAITKNPSFGFLNDDAEDIYTITDGKPLINEK